MDYCLVRRWREPVLGREVDAEVLGRRPEPRIKCDVQSDRLFGIVPQEQT